MLLPHPENLHFRLGFEFHFAVSIKGLWDILQDLGWTLDENFQSTDFDDCDIRFKKGTEVLELDSQQTHPILLKHLQTSIENLHKTQIAGGCSVALLPRDSNAYKIACDKVAWSLIPLDPPKGQYIYNEEAFPPDYCEALRIAVHLRTPNFATELLGQLINIELIFAGLIKVSPDNATIEQSAYVDNVAFSSGVWIKASSIDPVEGNASGAGEIPALDWLKHVFAIWGLFEKEFEEVNGKYGLHVPDRDMVTEWRPSDLQFNRESYTTSIYKTREPEALNLFIASSVPKLHINKWESLDDSELAIGFLDHISTFSMQELCRWIDLVLKIVELAQAIGSARYTFQIHGEITFEALIDFLDIYKPDRSQFTRQEKVRTTIPLPLEVSTPLVKRDTFTNIPQSKWDLGRLAAVGATRPGKICETNLDEDFLTIFAIKRFRMIPVDLVDTITAEYRVGSPVFDVDNIPKDIHQKLTPAFVLASKLLELDRQHALIIGGPLVGRPIKRATNHPILPNNAIYSGNEIINSDKLGPKVLKTLAEKVFFHIDPNLYQETGQLGSCHLGQIRWQKRKAPGSFWGLGYQNTILEDEKFGSRDRKCQITIATELINAVSQSHVDSQEHCFAIFYLAVILVREIGRAFWIAHPDNDPREVPRVGRDVEADLGDAMLGSLFGGWIPEPIESLDGSGAILKNGLSWRKWWRHHDSHGHEVFKPLYDIKYSIPLHYMARLLNHKVWNSNSQDRVWAELVRPQTPFRKGFSARIARLIDTTAQKDQYWGDIVDPLLTGPFIDQNWSDKAP
ncbi:MAG: hypothetical protein M1829_002862 [Trizodia sp. TS-e1964]|nr:MAG: hypothetical protein M1829_002862 [Trizodia sp. TS-e1964]